MSRLPLQTLARFRAIARTGNLRAAAEELHHAQRGQPAVAAARDATRLRAVRPARAPHRAQRGRRGAAARDRPGAGPDRRRRARGRRRGVGRARSACASRCCRRSRSAGCCRAWASGAQQHPDIAHRVARVAADRRPAARGLSCGAAPGPRRLARPACRSPDRLAARAGRLAAGGATAARQEAAALAHEPLLGSRPPVGTLVRAVRPERARQSGGHLQRRRPDAAGGRAEPGHRAGARGARRRRVARAAPVSPVGAGAARGERRRLLAGVPAGAARLAAAGGAAALAAASSWRVARAPGRLADASPIKTPAGTAAAGRTGSRSRARVGHTRASVALDEAAALGLLPAPARRSTAAAGALDEQAGGETLAQAQAR